MRVLRWSAFFLFLVLGCSQTATRSAETAPAQPPQPAASAPIQLPPPAPTPQAGSADAQGQPCQNGKCPAPLTCITYYGIAGPRGPAFTSCEIPCAGGAKCPKGQTCVVVADGPGQVCRSPE
jgi:hypothetical protein